MDPDPDPTTNFFLDLDPPMLQNDPPRLPLFHFDPDPDTASQNDADPCGSGSATLLTTLDDLGRSMYRVPYLGLRWNPCSFGTARLDPARMRNQGWDRPGKHPSLYGSSLRAALDHIALRAAPARRVLRLRAGAHSLWIAGAAGTRPVSR